LPLFEAKVRPTGAIQLIQIKGSFAVFGSGRRTQVVMGYVSQKGGVANAACSKRKTIDPDQTPVAY
jgi:hypothetical protein